MSTPAAIRKQNEDDDDKVNLKKTARTIYMWLENDIDPIMRKVERFKDEGWYFLGYNSRWSNGALIYTASMHM
jgi:hypothetical protein